MTNVVWARQGLPAGPSIFLAGPTRDAADPAPSWRKEAIALLAKAGAPNIITPESFQGIRADNYDQQFTWECAARSLRNVVILYWIPRDVNKLPGFTTNVEFGYDVASARKVVLGSPVDCPNPERNRYLVALANTHSVPVRTDLFSTVSTAVHWMRHGWPSS